MERLSKGEFGVLVKELKLFDHEFFFKQFRMTPEKLENLLTMVATRIMISSLRREVIGPRERLCVTLRYYASDDLRGTIAAIYRFSPVTVSRISNETCLEIWNSLLQEGYWKKIADNYYQIWNFPNCIGSTDGKHFVMQAPMRSGSSYINYKGTQHCLDGCCDIHYRIILVNIEGEWEK